MLLNSVVPGIGNVYGRRVRKGILLYVAFLVVVFSVRFTAFHFGVFLFCLVLMSFFYLYTIISGYRDVKKGIVYEPVSYDKWYVYILAIGFHLILVATTTGRVLGSVTPIDFASIPTASMDPGLVIGDRFAFEKTNAIQRNDVVVFQFPQDTRTLYVKRCIAMPGDSLQISNGTVLVNGDSVPPIPIKFRYKVTTNGSTMNSRVLEKYQIQESDYVMLSYDTYDFFLTEQQAGQLRQLPFLKSVELSLEKEGEADPMIYPKSMNLHWNSDFYGPLYIPKKGDKIELTEENIDRYLKCIEFENLSVDRGNNGLWVNGQSVITYEFKQNYFFMMGDNRHNSLDSRFQGLIPQELIVGKAMYLYWASTNDRIGKKVE